MKYRIIRLFSISPLKITLFIILIALIFFFLDVSFLRFMELKALDFRIISRGKVPAGKETVIAAIDEKSLSELGRWPWPRTSIAKLVERLKDYGAKAVGFDIVFTEPDENSGLKTLAALTDEAKRLGIADKRLLKLLNNKKTQADTDAILAHAITKAKNVTLGFFFHLAKSEVTHLTEKDKDAASDAISGAKYPVVKSMGVIDESSFIHAYAAASNLKILSESAENCGFFNAIPDSDGAIRWSPLVIKFHDNFYSSLALSLVMQYLDHPPAILSLSELGVAGITIDRTDIPADGAGRILINYLGPAKTFPRYSVADILKGRIPPEAFRDKIVLVGATATGIYDIRVTPFSTVYPGVEIHATVIDNILHQSFLKQSWWIKFLDIIFIIGTGLVMGLVIPKLSAKIGILVGFLLILAFIVCNIFLFSHYSAWLNLIYPVLTMVTVYLAITVYRYITEEREKKKIRHAFQYYLTASVINEMLKDPNKLRLGGDKKQLTVLFSDIRGFTSISEQLAPEDLVRLLNEYLTVMTEFVFKYDGLLDKYMGDALMAVFGAPLAQPDHALRACRTALEMLQGLKKLQAKWNDEGRPCMNMGIGINTGDMVVGNMGSQMRFDYTVLGDNVNLGSRLEGLNKEYGTNIIISEFTYFAVKDDLFCRELDGVRVVGKKLPIKIYELLGEMKEAASYREFMGLFETGLERYKQARWDEAIAAFQQVLAIRPDDHPSEMYIKRCRELKQAPPPQPWDGVFTMKNK